MQFLLPSTHKTEAGIIFFKGPSSNSLEADMQPLRSLNPSNKINTSSNVIRRINIPDTIMNSKRNLETQNVMHTKNGSTAAKDVESCLMCTWTFPHSFRGEEKNRHMDRCMESLGEKDKKFWNQCMGDLKKYM